MVMWGAKAWFTWIFDYVSNLTIAAYVFFTVVALIYQFQFKIKLSNHPKQLLAFALLFLTFIIMGRNIFGISQDLLQYFPVFILLCDEENKEKHLTFISKTISYIIIIGLVLNLVRLMGMSFFEGIPIIYGTELGDYSYQFINYFFYLVNSYLGEDAIRFQSVFLEPGYLGTLVAFLLFLNNYEFKKVHNIFLILGLVFSFSLAGYLVFATGYLLRLREIKKSIIKPVVFIALLYSVMLIAPVVNGGHNYVNELIVERLQYDEDKFIIGNDRFHGDTDEVYESLFTNGGFLFGIGGDRFKRFDISGAGYKIFIIQHGIVPYILFMLFYIILAGTAKNKKHALFACVLLFLISLQSTTLQTYRWIIPFVLMLQYHTPFINSRIQPRHERY